MQRTGTGNHQPAAHAAVGRIVRGYLWLAFAVLAGLAVGLGALLGVIELLNLT